mmetsp:Transcript_7644/g.18886  ORF Transcript_7644/g.18886 Transcript_7644/m.18886 type:complete len:543 (+) Transcript_7644:96-1724(+)
MTMRRTTTTTRAYHHHLLYHSSDLHRIEQQQCYKRGAPSLALFLLTMMIIIIDAVVVDVDAFGISSGSINDNSNSPPRWRLNSFRIQNIGATTTSDRGNTNTVLSAVMYGTDGKKISDVLRDHDDDKPNEPSIIPDRRFDTKLAGKLNTKTSVAGLLKVVACAFAEPPHNTIVPKDVVVATLVEVSQKQMDIALGVKTFDESRGGGSSSSDGQQSLVQLLINVPLTTPCPPNESTSRDNDDDDIDRDVAAECVATTLIQLEPHAVTRMEKRERRQQQQPDEDEEEEEDEWPPKVVTDVIETYSKESPAVTVSTDESKTTYYEDAKPDSNYIYPDWWTFPSPLEKTLSDECDSMKSLLNEDDFATDRMQLSKQGQKYGNKESACDVVIQKSFVAIIGPAGIVMRTQQSNKDEELNVVEELVPVRFVRGATAKSPETLRDLVLELVEALEDAEQEEEEEETEKKEEVSVQYADPIVESKATPAAPVPATMISKTQDSVESSKDVIEARRQPKSPAEESKLAAKYASIEDIGDRAFAILKELCMI